MILVVKKKKLRVKKIYTSQYNDRIKGRKLDKRRKKSHSDNGLRVKNLVKRMRNLYRRL